MKTIDSRLSNLIPLTGALSDPGRWLPLLTARDDAVPRIEEILFFDIETTGFSPRSASIYLFGCACCEDGRWHIRQFFAQTPAEEGEVLRAFLAFASGFSFFVHFNGQTFDVPFLAAKCRKHALPVFSPLRQCDLYKRVSPYKNLLHLSGCRQKQLEAFLGIHREDPFHGGELIELYRSFCGSQDERLEQVLLLHNREDLSGLPALWNLLSYPAFLEQGYFEAGAPRAEEDGSRLLLPLSLPFPLPVPLSCRSQGGDAVFYLAAQENRAILKLPILEGELKYFYPDYKNYSYLPEEDQAIHKSVAVYVDKSRRMPATAATCYTRKSGRFLPLPNAGTLPELPRFRTELGSAAVWLSADEILCGPPERLHAYVRGALDAVRGR